MTQIESMDWCVSDVESATGGRLVCGDSTRRFSEVGIDSRALSPGSLFVAIVGLTHDGHRFADAAIAQGAAGVMIAGDQLEKMPLERWRETRVVSIAVKDTTRALGDLAAYHRKRAGVSVVAVTGSNGKTSTREMTAAVLRQAYHTLSTKKNYNNDIGLPLTLLGLTPAHEWAVTELGMNHFGEIRRLGNICMPDIGVITNIGPAHLEGVGSLDGVMAAKGELISTLAEDGLVILNADDSRCLKLAENAPREVLLFGLSKDARIRAEYLREMDGGTVFTLQLPGDELDVRLNVAGRFMVLNALAAAAVGFRLGLPAEKIKAGLERFRPVTGRAMIVNTVMGIHVIDDSYNANPGSMAAAVSMLKELGKDARCFFAAGDMLELGPNAASFHRELGKLVARSGVFRLAATGEFAGDTAAGAQEGGLGKQRILTGTREDILIDFQQQLLPGDWVLVKGSRTMGMEKLVQALVPWAGGPAETTTHRN